MNELQFSEQYLGEFIALAELDKAIKQAKADFEEHKAELLKLMQEHNIKSIDNKYVKLTVVPESVSISTDWKAFQFEEPDLYERISGEYTKETKRKPYLKVTSR